jgi:hydroxymethylglutaryl-CoA lyase
MQEIDVLVSEVGPRDGLQSIKRTMPAAYKLRWISALAAAGVREIEVGSFVPVKLLRQMGDAAEVIRGAAGIAGLNVRSRSRRTSRACRPPLRRGRMR